VAIAHDSTTATTSGGKDVSGITFPHTVGAGSDRYLKVGVAINQLGPATVSSITYAGVPMTRLGDSVQRGFIRVEYWYLLNPPTGTNDVVVTLSDSPMNLACAASSYFGVNQTTPHGTESTATGVGTGPSVSVQSASGELVVDVMACADTGHVSVGSGQTLRGVADNGTTEAVCAVSDEAGATSVTMSHTIGAANDWAIIGVSLRPAAVGGEAIEGSLSATLGALTLVAAGTLEVQGSLAVTLAPLTLTAAASLAIDAELDQTLGPLVLESTGQLLNPISGALEVTLGALALHSAGQLSVTGSLEQTLAPLSMVAEGRLEIIASLDRILGDLTLTAEGSLENAIHGALEVVLGELTLAATGSLRITGALDVTLGALVLQAVGSLDGYDSGFYIDGRTEARITEPYGSLTLYSDGEGGFFSIE